MLPSSSHSFVRVWRARDPQRSWDEILWTPKKGLTVPLKGKKHRKWQMGDGITHGTAAWAEEEGKPDRILVRFDVYSMAFVLPDEFRERCENRRKAAEELRRLKKIQIDARFRSPKTPLHTSPDRSMADGLSLRPMAAM